MSVKLREKELSDGRISLYLDIYHNKKRSYDFLEIYIEGKRTTRINKEKLELAEQIREDTQHQLTVLKRNLPNGKQGNADIFAFIAKRPKNKQRRFLPLVKHLKKFAGETIPFRTIDKGWLISFQSHLTSETERTENTVNNYMTLLNTILNEAMREDIIPFNPWTKVPMHLKAKYVPPKIDTLEPDEIRKMIEHSEGVDSEVKNCFLFSIFTGFRWGDASNLLKSSVRTIMVTDKEGKTARRKFVVFTQQKTQTQKNLPLTVEAVRILAQRLLDERKKINDRREAGLKAECSDRFFPSLSFREGDTQNKRHSIMQYNLKKWVGQSGIKKRVYFHLTRHTFATLGLEKIGDLSIISSLLGHRRLATTQRYAHVLDRLKVESIDRMSSYGILK